MKLSPLPCALCLCGLLAPAAARAGGYSMPDIGVRRSGMLANTAMPDDPTAVFHNAAGLSEQALKGTQVFATFTGAAPLFRMRMYDSEYNVYPDDGGWYRPSLSFGAAPFVGVATDKPAEWTGVKGLAAGAALYVPNAMGAFLPEDIPSRFHMVKGFTIAGFGTGAVSWRINDWITVGASASAVYAYMSQDKVLSVETMLLPDTRFDPDPDFEKEGRQKLNASGWAPSFAGSLLLHLPGKVTLGVVADAPSEFDLEGEVFVDAKISGMEAQTVRHHTNLIIPWDVKIGLNWETPFLKGLHLAADLRYWHYSSFQEQVTEFSEPLEVLGLMPGGDKNRSVAKVGYTDSQNLAIGASYVLNEKWEFMAGGQRDWSPVPDGKHSVSNLAADLWGLCAGVTYKPSGKTRLGAAVMHNWMWEIDERGSTAMPPENFLFQGHNWELVIEGGHAF